MLRALLIAVTLLPIACDTPATSGPAVVAGATAGTVEDVAGKVTATRGGATRDLAKGDAISGDDVIATGTDGSVTIVLAHNNARWVLAANKSYRVSDSLAWSLPKREGSAAAVVGDTSSAGRHSERQSADTAGSVVAGGTRSEAGSAQTVAPDRPVTAPTTADGAAEAARRAEEVARRKAEEQRAMEKASDEKVRAEAKQRLEQAREAEEKQKKIGRPDFEFSDDNDEVLPKPYPTCALNDPLCDKDMPTAPEPTAPERARAVFLGDKALRACAKTAKVTLACTDNKCEIRTTTVDAKAKVCIATRVGALAPSLPAGKYDVVLEF